ncbi:VOC family protein [Amycolatopsis sacchari]|uniref:VOC family protein n=1 Tax=Amycolatopsis sacchari TaxID=115433 RepID=UPI003EBE4A64
MNPLAVHHAALTVSDVDSAIAFYTTVLGLTPRTDRPAGLPPGAWLDAAVRVSEPVPIGAARQAFLADPDGNAIELHER